MVRSVLQSEVKKSKPFDSDQQEALLNIVKTASELMGPLSVLLRSRGLSLPMYNILRILSGHEKVAAPGVSGLPCLEIADRMVTREPDITRLINRLDRAGFVRRAKSKQDRRIVLVSISGKGRVLLKRLEKPVGEFHRRVLGHMSEREMSQINRLMVKARGPL